MPVTTQISTPSLHDAPPISNPGEVDHQLGSGRQVVEQPSDMGDDAGVGGTERHALEVSDLEDRWGECHGNFARSEEHTSELQSQFHLVCRLLLEKKNRERRR